MPPVHDCEYVRCRNALIPTAERIATELAGENGGGYWTRVFADTVERLCHETPALPTVRQFNATLLEPY